MMSGICLKMYQQIKKGKRGQGAGVRMAKCYSSWHGSAWGRYSFCFRYIFEIFHNEKSVFKDVPHLDTLKRSLCLIAPCSHQNPTLFTSLCGECMCAYILSAQLDCKILEDKGPLLVLRTQDTSSWKPACIWYVFLASQPTDTDLFNKTQLTCQRQRLQTPQQCFYGKQADPYAYSFFCRDRICRGTVDGYKIRFKMFAIIY